MEKKLNHQIKKSNFSYRDLNFFNEDISWASIDADLFYTSWDLLLTNVFCIDLIDVLTKHSCIDLNV